MHEKDNSSEPVPEARKRLSVRRLWPHALIWGSLILYLVLVNPTYLSVAPGTGQPNPGWLDTLAESEMRYAIDALRWVGHDGQDMYRLDGWAFAENLDIPLSRYQKRIVLISDEGKAYLFDAIDVTRQDVGEHYANLSGDLKESGFAAYLSIYALPRGVYQVGIVYTAPSARTDFAATRFFIERTPNTLSLHKNHPAPRPAIPVLLAIKAKSAAKQALLEIDPSGELLRQARQALGMENNP